MRHDITQTIFATRPDSWQKNHTVPLRRLKMHYDDEISTQMTKFKNPTPSTSRKKISSFTKIATVNIAPTQVCRQKDDRCDITHLQKSSQKNQTRIQKHVLKTHTQKTYSNKNKLRKQNHVLNSTRKERTHKFSGGKHEMNTSLSYGPFRFGVCQVAQVEEIAILEVPCFASVALEPCV